LSTITSHGSVEAQARNSPPLWMGFGSSSARSVTARGTASRPGPHPARVALSKPATRLRPIALGVTAPEFAELRALDQPKTSTPAPKPAGPGFAAPTGVCHDPVASLPGIVRSLRPRLDREVILLSLTSLVVMLGSSIITPVLPLYAREFGASYAGAGLLVSAFAVGRLLFDYAGGVMAERSSPRALATFGALVSAASAWLSARAGSFEALVVYRVVEGLGSAFYVITIMAQLARTVPPERMGQAMSFYQSMVLLGVTFGPTVGGVAAEAAGSLRAPFYAMALLDVAVAAATWLWVSREPKEDRSNGTARPSLRHLLRHFSSRPFVYVLALTVLVFGLRAGTRSSLIPLFAGERGGLGETAIGLVLSASAFSNFAVLWHAGSLLDRRGRQRVALPALLGTAVLCALFARSPSFWNLLTASTLLGIALGYLAPAPAAMLADLTPPGLLGPAIGIYRMAGDLGLLVGPVGLGVAATVFGFEASFLLAGAAAAATFVVGRGVPETLGTAGANRTD
jgi:MFS family permease